MMKTLIIALLAAPIATAGRRNTSAWNTPSRGRFGIRRTNTNDTSGSYIVEQALSASSSSSSSRADEVVDMNMILQLQDEESSSQMIEESMMTINPNSKRIVTDGVRAAAVACVSAAAIGGARHALEMIL